MNDSGPAPAQSARAIRVMVIDDHPIVAESLTAILEREGDAEVVTRATCGAELGAQLAAAVRDGSRTDDGNLSPRETEILTLLCEGLDPAAIAQQLRVSPLTVKTHLARLYAKLGVHDRAAAVAKAFRTGLVDR